MAVQSRLAEIGMAPRLLKRQEAAAYCSLSARGFSEWVKAGRLPGPIPGTARWDRRAIDAVLDEASGLETCGAQEDAFDRWKREKHEKRTSRYR
jgi:predicted DNA-binding transcriptional regulator AlpA